jgi:hypothetical protein
LAGATSIESDHDPHSTVTIQAVVTSFVAYPAKERHVSTYGESSWQIDSVDPRTAGTTDFGVLFVSGQQHGGRDDSTGASDPFLAARALIARLDPPTSW